METELNLPDERDALRRLAVDLATELRQLKSEYTTVLAEKAVLQEQINLLLHKRFGANSEKYRAEQADLFNEAEAYAEECSEAEMESADSAAVEAPVETAAASEPTAPRKPGRKALPAELPRVEIVHDLPEDQRYCAEGHALTVIGEDVSEQLDIIPAKVQVLRHIRKKYACPCCQANVKTAPLPPPPIPKSNASPGLLAYVTASKFVDALPLNRQSKQFDRIGVELNRGTLSTWMIRSGQLIQPLINLLEEHLLHYPVLQMDDDPQGCGKCRKCRSIFLPPPCRSSKSLIVPPKVNPTSGSGAAARPASRWYCSTMRQAAVKPWPTNCCKTFPAPCKPTVTPPMRRCAPKTACATPAAGRIVGAISMKRLKPQAKASPKPARPVKP
jgi:transposase